MIAQWANGKEDMMSYRNTMISVLSDDFQGQESWVQATTMALLTKSCWVHRTDFRLNLSHL